MKQRIRLWLQSAWILTIFLTIFVFGSVLSLIGLLITSVIALFVGKKKVDKWLDSHLPSSFPV